MRAALRLLIFTALVLPLLSQGGAGAYPGPIPAYAALAGSGVSAPPALAIRLYFRDHVERDRLAAEWGAEEAPTTGGYLTLIAEADTLASLRARGHRAEIDPSLTADLARFAQVTSTEARWRLGAQPGGDTFYGGYLTVEGIEAFLDRTAAAYPGLAEKVDIGDSWCKAHPGACVLPSASAGYDLYAFHITNRAVAGPKPVFWFDAGMHSREIATPEVAMRFIRHLLEGYETDPDARWLVDHHDIWVVPLVNPDGYRVVSLAPEGEPPYSQRKNADSDDGCAAFPPTGSVQLGTDLNRNFPYRWGCCEGSTDRPCTQTYRGPAPGSEDETQAVMAKLRELIPDQRGPGEGDPAPITTTGVYQNLHSFANLNLYSWGWGRVQAPNEVDIRNIAARMSAPEAGGNGYDYCAAPYCLYSSDGTATDWVYGELGVPAFTTETGGESFFPLYEEAAGLWEENRGMLLYLARIARAPYLISRGPEVAPTEKAVRAVAGGRAQVAAAAGYSWEGNQYAQAVGGAEVYVDVPPWQGGTAVPMFPTDGALDSPLEAVAANIDTQGLAPGRHLLFVRARGASGYEGHESWGPIGAAWLVVEPEGASTERGSGVEGARRSPGRAGR